MLNNALRLDNIAIPATEMRGNYHGQRHLDYWLSGLSDFAIVMQKWRNTRSEEPTAMFELGTLSGRVLRHFATHFPDSRVVGSDIRITEIEWMIRNMPSNVFVFQNTIVPHLPLPDRSFDITMAFSVFTHIDTYELAWLAELLRITRDNGMLFLTVQTERAWNRIMQEDKRYRGMLVGTIGFGDYKRGSPMPESPGKLFFPSPDGAYGSAFHTSQYIRTVWGRLLRVNEILQPESRLQDTVVLHRM